MKQKVEFDIEWPEDREYVYYVAPRTEDCEHGWGFRVFPPDSDGCHIIIERPREVCGKSWAIRFDRSWYATPSTNFRCTLDAGHDGPCMMELGRAE